MNIKNVESLLHVGSRLDEVGSVRLPYFKFALRSRILFYFIFLTNLFSIFVMNEMSFFYQLFPPCIVTILTCILKIVLI